MTRSEYRVLVLINTVDDTAGGNLRAAVNIAEAMAADGAAVTFSAPCVSNQPRRTVEGMDARVERRLFRASRPVGRFGGSARQAWWLLRHLREFDEVQTHSLFSLSAVYAIVIGAIHRVPVLLWPHGSIDPFDLRKHARFKKLVGPLVTRRLLGRCAALLFTTTHEERIAVTYGARTRREVVPLPVAPLRHQDADTAAWRARYGIPAQAPIVLFLGRIDYKKRLPLLVEAVALMRRTDAHLVVAGQGTAAETDKLGAAIGAHDIADRVHLTGWLEGADRTAAFLASDVFALLSDTENFGLAVVEALSVGRPAVISDQVFIAEDLARAGAVAVVPRDAAVAARAIDAMLDDPVAAARMGECGRSLVARTYTPHAVAQRLRDVNCSLQRVESPRHP